MAARDRESPRNLSRFKLTHAAPGGGLSLAYSRVYYIYIHIYIYLCTCVWCVCVYALCTGECGYSDPPWRARGERESKRERDNIARIPSPFSPLFRACHYIFSRVSSFPRRRPSTLSPRPHSLSLASFCSFLR